MFETHCHTPRKHKYLDEVTARAEAAGLVKQRTWPKGRKLAAYKCRSCIFWHVTTVRKPRKRSA